jgi:hypothetical protein
MTADPAAVDVATIRSTFRRLTPERHPILAELSRDAIYDEGRCMAARGVFDVEACTEFEDGYVMWEDDVLYRGNRAGWSTDYLSRAGWLIRHIQYGQAHPPRLTHFLLKAVRPSTRLTMPATRVAHQGFQP